MATFLTAGLAILALMTAVWLFSLLLKDASIVDIFWGAGFIMASWIYFVLSPSGYPPRKWLVFCLTSLWGFRLSLYILWRNWGKGEDVRYQKWRQQAGTGWWWRSYFKVFLLQGCLMWVISTPLLIAQTSQVPQLLVVLDYLGIFLWIIGFFFETVGDWQLARFKGNPSNQGQVLDTGLWRYTRHPNYFGDALQWWGFYLIATAAGGFWTVFSPVIMTILLARVSGVALLEKSLAETKPAYRKYISSTSAFIPWFPRKPTNHQS